MTLSHADFLKKYLQGTAQLGVNRSRIGNVLGSPVYQAAFRRSDYASMLNIVGRPYTTAGGKTAHARVQRVGQPLSDDVRTWGAHERIAGVRRA